MTRKDYAKLEARLDEIEQCLEILQHQQCDIMWDAQVEILKLKQQLTDRIESIEQTYKLVMEHYEKEAQ